MMTRSLDVLDVFSELALPSLLSLRALQSADDRWLHDLSLKTLEEVDLLGLPQYHLSAFIRESRKAMLRDFKRFFPSFQQRIVEFEGQAIGTVTLQVDISSRVLNILEISLYPTMTLRWEDELIKAIQHVAHRFILEVSVQIYLTNHSSFKRYTQLGFEIRERELAHIVLSWYSFASPSGDVSNHEEVAV